MAKKSKGGDGTHGKGVKGDEDEFAFSRVLTGVRRLAVVTR